MSGLNPGTKKTMLSMTESFKLAEIVRARYTTSGLDNVAFARSVNDTPLERALFRSDITASNIGSVVEACGIEGNRARASHKTTDEGYNIFLTNRVAALEDQVNKLAHTVAKLMEKK